MADDCGLVELEPRCGRNDLENTVETFFGGMFSSLRLIWFIRDSRWRSVPAMVMVLLEGGQRGDDSNRGGKKVEGEGVLR